MPPINPVPGETNQPQTPSPVVVGSDQSPPVPSRIVVSGGLPENGVPVSGGTSLLKKFVIIKQVIAMIVGGFIAFIGLIIGLLFMGKSAKAGIIIILIVGGIGVLIFVLSFISHRQLTRSIKNPPQFNSFQTTTAVQYKMPGDSAVSAAVAKPNEAIGSWLGPVNRKGMSGVSFQVLSKEVDNQSENTLLFTQTQIIGLMITPQDLGDVQQSAVRGVLNQVINNVPGSAIEKDTQFEALNSKKWEQLVASLSSQSLQSVLGSHFNFGIPYSLVQSVEVHDSLINSGLTFHLSDGSKLGYATLRKEQIPNAVNYLRQFISTQ